MSVPPQEAQAAKAPAYRPAVPGRAPSRIRSVRRCKPHGIDVVDLMSRRVTAPVGGDMDVVIVVGGFVAVVGRPTPRADTRVDFLPPDHVIDAPPLCVRQGVA